MCQKKKMLIQTGTNREKKKKKKKNPTPPLTATVTESAGAPDSADDAADTLNHTLPAEHRVPHGIQCAERAQPGGANLRDVLWGKGKYK
jgi:hypothetical protein